MIRAEEFRERATGRFGFLVSERGFTGPELHDHGVFYYDPVLSVDVILDEREKSVLTLLCRTIGETYVRAELSILYVECGLGPAQHVGVVAGSRHSLEKSLESQAAATGLLLDRLLGAPDRDEMLRRCHGR